MKFIYFTDVHIRATSPTARKDDFLDTVIKKLKYVAKLGEEEQVSGFICGGDLIDRPDIPYSALAKLSEALSEFKKPIYTVLGNHDIYGYNPETHHRTALSVFTANGMIKRLEKDKGCWFHSESGDVRVSLTGCDSHDKLDKDGRVSDYTDITIIPDAVNIHVVHGFLKEIKSEIIPSTGINDIINTKADIVLTGHDHSGFGVIERNGKIFCNPGALSRVTASVGDVNLDVKVAIIDIRSTSDYSVSLRSLPIDVARPSNEVLDRQKLEEEKQHQQTLTEFSLSAQGAVKQFAFGNSFDVYEVLDHVVKTSNISDNVYNIIKEKIEEAEEELKKEA